jgi:hypothetical protein
VRMLLYHFTSMRHLYAISREGLTVGDVPTDFRRGKGRVGVWLTSDGTPNGHGLEGSASDKTRVRLLVDVPEGPNLVRWVDWARRNVKPETIENLHASGQGFQNWYVYFGVIDLIAITQCLDMASGQVIDDWTRRESSPFDVRPVPSWRREAWRKKMIKQVDRALRRHE